MSNLDGRHNHAPRCCCDDGPDLGGSGPCPACPEHGELAPGIECPQCHQPIGRPHTEFCTLAPDRVWPGPRPVDRPECGHPDWPDCPHPQHQRPLR